MKKYLVVFSMCLFAIFGGAMAQHGVKLGHINSTELMQIMPGRDSAEAILQKEVAVIESEYKAMQEEWEKLYNEYQQNKAGWTELIRTNRESTIQDLSARLEAYQQNAQKQLQEREAELVKPIIDRAKKAIEEVAKEQGYTYILDSGTAAILYSQDSDDIMPLVKKKLGLK